MCFNFRHLPAIDSCACQRKMIWYWIAVHVLSRMWTYQMQKHLVWLHCLLYKYGAKHVGAETMWNTWKNVFCRFYSLLWCVSTSDIYQQLIAAHANARWYGIELLFMCCQECEPIRCQSTWRGCMAYCTRMRPNMLVPKPCETHEKYVFWRFLVYFEFQLQISTSNW